MTTFTYAIDILRKEDQAKVTKILTTAEAKDIGDFDLRRIAGNDFFKPAFTYTVTLKTYPAPSEAYADVRFFGASPQFRMRDRSGRVFHSGAKEALTVCPGKMVMDANASSCESSYFVTVQESDASWNRTYRYEFGRWFTGQAPDGIDLDQLIARHPDSVEPGKKAFELVAGGTRFRPVPRYFRIGLATGEPRWDITWLLVRTGTDQECSEPFDPSKAAMNHCPRKDNIPFGEIRSELTRLFVSPCIDSLAPCLFGASERQRLPTAVGPKQPKEVAWQGPLNGNTVDLETQDRMVAGMKTLAAKMAPNCSTGVKKVPIAIDLETDTVGTPPHYRVLMNVTYACCAKSPF